MNLVPYRTIQFGGICEQACIVFIEISICAPRRFDVHAEMEHRRARDRMPRGLEV
jgi:hypothetical protein